MALTKGTSAVSQSPPADWYIDPENPSLLRYWDGVGWTERRAPRKADSVARSSTPSVPAPQTPDPDLEATVSTPLADTAATPPAAGPKLVTTPARYWLGGSRGWPSVDVVGEAYREGEVLAALGRRPKLDEEIEVRELASLVPEPDNPHDRNAVSVRINGHLVGYLSKDDAKRNKPYIDRVVASGHIPTTNASIWAVLRKTYDGATRFNSNVRLALSEPHLLLPVNDPPAAAYSVLPWGGGLQVTGEDQHFDVLKPFVGRHDRELLIVTLHRVVEAKPRGDREFVEVRVDGQRIGEMSTATSKHFFPILDHLESKNLTAAAWAHLKGSSLTAEVVLQAVKASEVEDAWLTGDAETVPTLVPKASSYYVPPAYQVPKRTAPTKAKATTKAKAKRPDPMASALRASAAPAKSGCAVFVLAAAATAVAVPVFTHLV
jgi:collagen type III alpha